MLLVAVKSDDDFALGAPFAKMPERFSRLTQRIISVNNGHDRACRTQLRDRLQVFAIGLHRQDADFLARGSGNAGSEQQNLDKSGDRTADTEVTAIGFERPLVGEDRTVGDDVQDQIILLPSVGEVFPGIVNDMVGA